MLETVIKVDPEVWLRGTGAGVLLEVHTGQRCCIGIAASQLGVPDDLLLGVGALEDEEFDPEDGEPEACPRALSFLRGNLAAKVYRANDAETAVPDAARIANINALTVPHGLRFALEATP